MSIQTTDDVQQLSAQDVPLLEALISVFGEAFQDTETYGGHCAGSDHLRRLLPALVSELLELPNGALHDAVIHEEWAELRKTREALDAAIETWVRDMPPDVPFRTMQYTNTKGVLREHPAWQGLTHFFNHQTHHRGQVTTLLSQAGVDVGLTDIIALA